MSRLPFHPAVSAWLERRFGQPTEVQAQAWAVTSRQRHALIAAPTGSGKTLAAFLSAIDALVREGLAGGLTDEVHVLYVSPLKALSNDIRKNLQEPLAGIRAQLAAMGLPDPGIRDAVRTGDTPAAERERMRRTPPHILVTTPESLYILLSSDSGRAMLKSVKSVIVDELHAVAGSKRGSHLMLSIERLEALCERPPVRIGLSATVKPLQEMARFLIGARDEAVEIIDAGHIRERDLAIEMPRSPLTAVMPTEVWDELYDRLAELIHQHRTTLIFVNQRRTAERMARHLAERIGEEHVTAHHGSLAREHRLQAEQRLKQGELKALVATSSLELGIDIGDIDLVCQIGSPRAVNAFLQRVGRAGHAIGAIPKGRLFPLALDDLLECAALLDAVARGELDRIRVPAKPLDALAQQVVAETTCREWPLDALYERLRRAQPYRELALAEFEQLVQMLADGYSTRRGRRGAYLHYDGVNRMLRARRGARLAAVTNAGVIPDQFDYDVVLLPEEHRVGTLNEDFAFESLAGDIFQLGNTSYRIVKVETGRVLVEDARGQAPNMPFWLGEGLGRSDELCEAVSRLCETADSLLEDGVPECAAWLREVLRLPAAAAEQLTHYLAAARAALGALPTRKRIVFERFFDEVGDTHLVIHSPYGSRINKAWGLALRKRMCRKFNFELQASALEDSIVLSLGPTHSFPLDEVQHYLKSGSARDVLVQALLDAPMFGTRWRWNATASLAVRRMNGGRKVPPQFQRTDAQDLLTVVFPDQIACAENLVGEREIPDHPLVAQTLRDCLTETMDAEGFVALLARIETGEVQISTRELASPSPLSHAILNARPFAFLDDGAAEERRTRAVRTQPIMDLQTAQDIGKLDPEAIAQVRADAWPEIGNAEELHDALVVHGFLTTGEAPLPELVEALVQQRRITRLHTPAGGALQVAAERLHEMQALFPQAPLHPPIEAVVQDRPAPEMALREIVRGRLEMLGPVTAGALGAPLGLPGDAVLPALLALEAEGAVMRGASSAAGAAEWCDRRLLARIHRMTRDKLRAEIQPVPPAQFMRFLFRWHQLAGSEGDERREGESSLSDVLRQLEGHAAPASAWEEDLLPARVGDYLPAMLDKLCAVGRIAWWRPAEPGEAGGHKSGPVRGTPVLLCERDALSHWQQAAGAVAVDEAVLSGKAREVLELLRAHGASFFADLQHDARLLGEQLEQALSELVAQGLVSCDSFAGLRTLVMPADKRNKLRRKNRDPIADAGRWALTRRPRPTEPAPGALAAPHVEHIARVLLRRYGVLFRKLIEREEGLPPWRELYYVLRRLEARGEVRGGRFVSGFSGEQFALPEAAAALRKTARTPGRERVAISAVDPLNLAGILTPGDKVPRLAGNRLLFEAGVPIATQSGGDIRYLQPLEPAVQWEVKNLLIRKQRPASYVMPPPGLS
ncbi:DEAD/DEAH box helicase [Ramlibacter solisilvae]|uniref:ATP-dependent DNA helicase n=1 Tax=Ramlibacter tataouinensis TaxID=94132 RepID=A0A127JQX9_9BURK|nr:DEAD/DEAH box helicase [Ramlibacter tataouinensis]AMO22335.1 ATP-dependent DNA helicase [Ramlibacter tataouinensis]